MKVLILGDGLLGSEVKSQTNWDLISRNNSQFDICNIDTFHKLTQVEFGIVQYCPYDIIVNCIACTDTYSTDKKPHWDTNIQGTKNLLDFCNKWNIKLVHISTDYLYTFSKSNATENDVPVHCATWYGYTKLISDALVQIDSEKHLIIRTTHKPKPFPYESAFTNQKGNFDYVDIISQKIINLVNKKAQGIYNVGTPTKTMYDLALKTNNNVKTTKTFNKDTPTNTTMNINKMKNFL